MYVIIALEAWDKIKQQRCIREISRGFERLSESTLLRRIDLWELYSRILSSHVHTEREEEREAFFECNLCWKLSALQNTTFYTTKAQQTLQRKCEGKWRWWRRQRRRPRQRHTVGHFITTHCVTF